MSSAFSLALLLIEIYLTLFLIYLVIRWVMITLWTNYKDEVFDAYLRYEMLCQKQLVKSYKNSRVYFMDPDLKKRYYLIPQNRNLDTAFNLFYNNPLHFSLLLVKRPVKCEINNMFFYKLNVPTEICLFHEYVLGHRRLRSFYKLAFLLNKYRPSIDNLVRNNVSVDRAHNIRAINRTLARIVGSNKLKRLVILTKFKIILDFSYWCLKEKNVILQKLIKTKKSWKQKQVQKQQPIK